jgi:hypothetical protein
MKKKKEKKKKRKIVKVFYLFIYDKITKIKEEFNILICSRSRIINLYVSCISNTRWKDKIFKTSLTRQSHEAAYLM